MIKKIICACIDVHETYGGDDFNEICNVSSRLKNEKLTGKKELVEKYKYGDDHFEQSLFFQNSKRCL